MLSWGAHPARYETDTTETPEAMLDTYVKTTGPRPLSVLDDALEKAGSETRVDGGGERSSNCPAHDDQQASLRWRETIDHRVLLHCHAGCDYKSILDALGLSAWQMQPMTTSYYWDAALPKDRARAGDRPVAVHVRQYTAADDDEGGKKRSPKFVWKHRVLPRKGEGEGEGEGAEEWRPGRGSVPLTDLWREPELEQWLRDGEGAAGGEIWIVEGEKDAWLTQTALDARTGTDGPGRYFVTTGGEGAAQDPVVTVRALERCLAARGEGAGNVGDGITIVLVGDRDPAGIRRVDLIAAETHGLVAAGCRIKTLYPVVGAGNDIGTIIDRWSGGTGLTDGAWLNQMVEEVGGIDPYLVPSPESGELYESDYGYVGRRGLVMQIGSGKNEATVIVCMVAPRVVGVEYDQQHRMIAWHLEWSASNGKTRRVSETEGGGPDGDQDGRYGGAVTHHERITNQDIRDSRSWANVVARTGGDLLLDGPGALTRMIRWLKWHSTFAPHRVTYPLSGWNHDTWSGQWVHVDYDRQIWPPVEAGAETETETETGEAFARARTGARAWSYGLDESGGGEREAAQIAAEMVWYRDPEEIVPLMGALAANAIRPIADRECGLVRLLQVAGRSGTGKTSSIQLVARLFGSSGWGTNDVSVAALGRIAETGTGPYWLDDPTGAGLEGIIDFLRGASTGGGRTRANMNGVEGTDSQVSEIFVIWSSEAAIALDEKAMRDRTILVEFRKHVENRISVRRPLEHDPDWNGDPEAEGAGVRYRKQWADLVARGVNGDHKEVTRIAGWVQRGLWRTALEVESGSEGWTDLIGPTTGTRSERSGRWVLLGATVLARWLAQWGHTGASAIVQQEGQRWSQQYIADALAAHNSGTDTYLVQKLLPALLHQMNSDSGIRGTGRKLTVGRGEDVRVVVRDAHAQANRITEYEALWLEFEDGSESQIWLNATQLLLWAKSDAGRRAGIDPRDRHLERRALDLQVGEVAGPSTQVTLRNRGADGGWIRGRYRALRPEITATLLSG